MNYGLYLSASGVLTNTYRQDVFANNLANVNTVGFKRDLAAIRQREPESIEKDFGFDLRHDLLDKLGGGTLAGPQRIDFTPGPLRETGNPLDVAISRENAFFVVAHTDPVTGEQSVRLTRNGQFTRNEQGRLVTLAGGHPLLNDENEPIVLPDGDVRIDANANILLDGEPIGRLQVAAVPDTDRLIKQGQNLFGFTGQDPRQPIANPVVHPGFVESSGVDPIKALMDLIDATKAITGNGNLIRYHDSLMDRAVNVLGRVA